MSLTNLLPPRTSLQSRVFLAIAPVSCLALGLLSAGTALYLHWQLGETLNSAESKVILWKTIALVGAFEFLGTIIILTVALSLSRKITRPITDLSLKALSITDNSSGLLPTNQDVTELNNLSTAFNRLIAEQRHRIQELSELSSNLLHDLKTPLANMRNDAEAALTNETDCTTALQDVCESCDKLLTAIGTNSDIAAIASGLNRSTSEDVNICEQIRTTVEIYQFFADSKHITLSTTLPHEDIHIRALKLRIQQLLSNLVDNAVKYTPDGGTVTITAKQEESQCVITVSDTGIGISEEALPKIFTRFFRADASRHEPGFGLGLPLVKAIVDFYHGTVVCSSVVGQGTSFTVVLPLAK